jgi:hypothetical protein
MITNTRRWLCIAFALTVSLSLTGLTKADRVQGFESGDPPVSSVGDAGKVGTFQGQAAPEGTMQFLLTTIGSMSNEDNLNPIFAPAVCNGTMEAFFNGFTLGGFEGSGVLIPFTVTGTGNGILTFQYDFLSNENFQSMPRPDFAFTAVFDANNLLVLSPDTFAAVGTSVMVPFNPDQSPFQFHTGLTSLALPVGNLTPGNYTLAIGVEDAQTADHASGVLIDDVQLVPEPSVIGLVTAGAGLLIALRRRIKPA